MQKATKLLNSFWFRYTVCFLIFLILVYAPLAITGKTAIWSVDGLEITYPLFAYEGRWLRGIVTTLLSGGGFVVPMWDMSIGLGSDISLIVGSNPFNLLSAFFPERYAEYGMVLVVVLELYLAGLSFSHYAFSHNKERFATLAGAMMYAFCGWAITAVLRQHLFVVPMVFFPLLLEGADKVFQKQSPFMFIAASALFFWTYFYLAYMACIALFFYCLYCFVRYEPDKTVLTFVKWVLKTAAFLAVGALIAGVVMLPAVMNVLGQGRLGVERVVPVLYGLSYYAQFVASFATIGQSGMDAFIGFGAFGFLACTMLCIQRGRKALKVAFIGATIMMLVPFFGHVFNGFSYVANRWAWIYSFLVAFVFVETLPSMLRIGKKDGKKLLVATICYGAVVTIFPNTRTAAGYACMSIMLIAIALFLIRQMHDVQAAHVTRVPREDRRTNAWMLSLLAISLVIPSFFWIYTGSNWAQGEIKIGSAYNAQHETPSQLVKDLQDDAIWRYDQLGRLNPRNNSMLLQLNSFDYYTQLYDERVDRFLANLDLETMRFSHFIDGLGGRSFVESALGTKYYLVRNSDIGHLPYGASSKPVLMGVGSLAGYSVFENELCMPIAYFTGRLLQSDTYDALSAVERQQAICQAIVVDDCNVGTDYEDGLSLLDSRVDCELVPYSDALSIDGTTITVSDRDQRMGLLFATPANVESYVLLEQFDYRRLETSSLENASIGGILRFLRSAYRSSEPTSATLSISASNGFSTDISFLTKSHHMYTAKNSALVNLGYNEDSVTSATITFHEPGVYSLGDFSVIAQPMANLESGVADLCKQPVELSEGVNSFTASVNAEEDGVMCLTVPWSSGWTVTVDGEKADAVIANEAFMGVALQEGVHVVELNYQSPWVREGAIMSIAGLVLLVGVMVARKLFLRNKRSVVRA